MSLQSYFYTRTNEWYELKNIVKLGMTTNIHNRDANYVTSEPIRGRFSNVFSLELTKEELRQVDKKMKEYLNEYNIKSDGGTEFYKVEILDKIHEFFKEHKLSYKKLEEDEIKIIKNDEKEKKKQNYQTQNIPSLATDVSIVFYDIDTCKIKVCEYIKNIDEEELDTLDLEGLCSYFCSIDSMFPSKEKWLEHYNINSLRDIIPIKKKKKQIFL